MRFHTFGDSHATAVHSLWTFPVAGAPICINHLPGKLMHSFAANPALCNVGGMANGDWACFCFGEIDTRCHVHRFVTELTPYGSVIDTLVAGYMAALRHISSLFEKINICVFMIPPPAPAARMYYPDVPFEQIIRGTDTDRLLYTTYFNNRLQTACSANGFTFIHAYNEYADADGFLLESRSDGICHLKYADPVANIVRHLVGEVKPLSE